MSVIVIRHGLSEANNRENTGSLAFAAEEAPLMELGREQARALRTVLPALHDIESSITPVATSTLLRTRQTAEEAGFIHINQYEQLNEVKHGMELSELRYKLDLQQLPKIALQAAEKTLEHMPSEKVWFTHGLRIAGLCAILGVYQDIHLIPRFCEIRELPISS